MRYACVVALAFVLLWLMPAYAAKDKPELPPPTTVKDTPEARETVPDERSDVNLQKELGSPKSTQGVQIRVYKRKDGATVHEYSVKGRVYMVRVQPSGGLPAYYLYDSDGDGTFERRLPGGYKRIAPPAWVIKRF